LSFMEVSGGPQNRDWIPDAACVSHLSLAITPFAVRSEPHVYAYARTGRTVSPASYAGLETTSAPSSNDIS